MSEVVVGLLGFACIVAIVVTLFKSKTLPMHRIYHFPDDPRSHSCIRRLLFMGKHLVS